MTARERTMQGAAKGRVRFEIRKYGRDLETEMLSKNMKNYGGGGEGGSGERGRRECWNE